LQLAQKHAEGEESEEQLMNVQLSAEETYADIAPLRPGGAVSAYLSIMRGCNNMCAAHAHAK
jgi:tRNA-2-methylthio-N6-dimethylallyladenosine synthase